MEKSNTDYIMFHLSDNGNIHCSFNIENFKNFKALLLKIITGQLNSNTLELVIDGLISKIKDDGSESDSLIYGMIKEVEDLSTALSVKETLENKPIISAKEFR